MSIGTSGGIDNARRLGARADRARETRRRIVAAATRLFVEQGYLPTTMGAIAKGAGVAVQTLYLSFGSKARILEAALDIAIVGDDQPIPLLERPWVNAMRAEADGPAAMAVMCHETAQLFVRVAPMHVVIRAATGDADVARLLAEDQRRRYETQRQFVAILAAKQGFNPSLDEDRATDLVYGLVSEAVYLLFCVDRAWQVDAWTAWVSDTLSSQFFPASRISSLRATS